LGWEILTEDSPTLAELTVEEKTMEIDRTSGIKVKISTYFRNFGLVHILMPPYCYFIKLFIYDLVKI